MKERTGSDDRWMFTQEAVRYMGYQPKKSTSAYLMIQREIENGLPVHMQGGRKRFRKSEIDSHLSNVKIN